MTFEGFLEHKRWVSMRNDLTRFGLVTDPGDLSKPPAKWTVRTDGWRDREIHVSRLKTSLLEETYELGQLSFDPTRYLALCFRNKSCYLVQLADIKPGRSGTMLFADGYLRMTEDFRRVIEEAYNLKSFTTYE